MYGQLIKLIRTAQIMNLEIRLSFMMYQIDENAGCRRHVID